MANCIRFGFAFIFAIALGTSPSGGTPLDFYEAVDVTPSRVINHDVQLKGPFDDEVTEALLTGPQVFSHAIGVGGKDPQAPNAYFNWYEIAQPATAKRRILTVRDAVSGNKAWRVTIEDPVFLLSPTQRITTGPPAEIPDGLNHFKAYRIVDGVELDRKVTLSGTFGPEDRTVTKAVLLCVPVEERHHDEHFHITNSQACMLVYELLPSEHSLSLTTIDQFGLNTLEVRSGQRLCVPAQILDPSSKDTR